MIDRLGDAVQEHIDTKALLQLIDQGPPDDLPFIAALAENVIRPPQGR